MSQVDEQHLRHLARDLANLYRELDSLKYSRPVPPEVRTMKPAPGPQSPGNWLYVACWLEQSTLLREVAFNALGDVNVKIRDNETGPVDLCTKIAFHAQAISELEWANDLVDELEHQMRVIGRRCNPPEVPQELARRAQSHTQLYTASHVAKAASAATGKTIDRKHVTYLGRAGYIPVHTDTRGQACYRLSDVVNYLHKQVETSGGKE